MKQISFTYNAITYSLDATNFGVDIFKDGKYFNTVSSDEKGKDKPYWIGKGIEFILDYLLEK